MSTPFNSDWESTMTKEEVRFIWDQINIVLATGNYDCADSFRGARAWKSSQIKRFKKLRTCCGCYERIVKRFNWRKLRFDKYLIGFNYGH